MAQENDLDNFLAEKFPEPAKSVEVESEEEENFENPFSAGAQFKKLREDYARTHPSTATKFKRLLAGRAFE